MVTLYNSNQPPANENMHEPLHSIFANDPDMSQILDMFINELPQRVTAIEQAMEQVDLSTIADISHQLKGAGGGYGFPTITDSAAVVEQLAKDGADVQSLQKSVQDLLSLCQRATHQSL